MNRTNHQKCRCQVHDDNLFSPAETGTPDSGGEFSPKNSRPGDQAHVYGSSFLCDTDQKGYPTPRNQSQTDLVLDASEGFIPLWEVNRILRWRFHQGSMSYFNDVETAKSGIRTLFSEAVMAWGDSAPVRFEERDDAWDFEIYMSNVSNCRPGGGCTLARAFFPDSGRHRLVLYPDMFKQSRKEQVDTFIHEFGHVFGLRHFFADVHETAYPSVIFGTHKPFTIMNYGHNSELTSDDKNDLKNLYQAVWRRELLNINGTPIVQVKPYHYLGFM